MSARVDDPNLTYLTAGSLQAFVAWFGRSVVTDQDILRASLLAANLDWSRLEALTHASGSAVFVPCQSMRPS